MTGFEEYLDLPLLVLPRSRERCRSVSPMSGTRCAMTKQEHRSAPWRPHRTLDQREFWSSPEVR